MATISIGNSGLPEAAADAANVLLANGFDGEAVPYNLPAAQATTMGISTSLLELLLKTGVASAPGQKGVVHSYLLDLRTGEIGFKLNYSLTA